MFHTPAHKQVDPAKQPAQSVDFEAHDSLVVEAVIKAGGGVVWSDGWVAAEGRVTSPTRELREAQGPAADDVVFEREMDAACPMCDGDAYALGDWGGKQQFRCRACSWTFAA